MLEQQRAVGNLNVGDLPKRWRQVDLLRARAQQVSQNKQPHSLDRASADATLPGGVRLGSQVESHLTSALDCHDALPKLLQSHGATRSAMWALLRAQLEASFYALWMLEPDSGRERVYRAVRLEWLDDIESAKYWREVFKLKPSLNLDDSTQDLMDSGRQEHEQVTKANEGVYRDECARLGRTVAKGQRVPNVNVLDELSKLKSFSSPAIPVALMVAWRQLAQLQHGSTAAILRSSERTLLGEVPGGQRLDLTPSDSHFYFLALNVAGLTIAALAAYINWHLPQGSERAVDLKAIMAFREAWNGEG